MRDQSNSGAEDLEAIREGISMNELIFLVESAPEGGWTARGLGEPIFTEADTLEELRANIRDAVACHFEPGKAQSISDYICDFQVHTAQDAHMIFANSK